MIIRDLTNEASPDTFQGSLSRDQLASRLWMSQELKKVGTPKSAAILGSWYGLLPFILQKFNGIDKIYAIDVIPGVLKVSKKINPNVIHINKDANRLTYDNVDCIINPSVNNIEGSDWYNNIPKGKLCLFQTENIELGNDCPADLKSMKEKYPLSKYLYSDSAKSKDKDGKLIRSMVIGYK